MAEGKVFLVASHEYLETVRTRAFWVGILAFPVILALSVLVPMLLARAKQARTFAVVDQSGFVLAEVEKRVLAADLRQVLTAAAQRYRQGGRPFERLPEPLRRLTQVWLAVPESRRDELAAGLAEPTPGQLAVPEEARAAVVELGGQLRTWWARVSATELDELGLEAPSRKYLRVEIPEGDDDPHATLNHLVRRGQLFAYFSIPADPVHSFEGCRYVSNNLTDRDLEQWFGNLAGEVVRSRRLAQAQIDPEVARWLRAPLVFEALRLGSQGEEAQVDSRDKVRQWAPLAFVYLLWLAVFTSAQMLLTSTIEEKSSRIVEVLLSSVSPLQLMTGKIAGMAAAGLTVVGSWTACALIALILVPAAMGAGGANLLGIVSEPLYLLSFLFYFLMGYLLYAALLVGVGSVCNNLKEAQGLMWPVLIVMLIPMFAMLPIGQDPNGLLARVLSFVPPFTPFVMMNRAAGPPAPWEYLATGMLLMGSIGAAVWGAAKVFRIGILMTGKPPRLREVLRWLSTSEPGQN